MSPDLQSYYDALKQNKEAQKVLKDVLTDKQTLKAFNDVLNDEQAMRGIDSLLKNEEFKQQALAQLGDEASLNEAVSVLKYEETLTLARQMGRCLAEHEAPAPAPGHDASAPSPEKDATAPQYQKYDSQRDSQCVQSPNGTWSCSPSTPNDVPNSDTPSGGNGVSPRVSYLVGAGVIAGFTLLVALAIFCRCKIEGDWRGIMHSI
jgi:hypothetical protein